MGFGGDIFRGRPEFAERVAEAIASWAQVEAGLGAVLASLLDVSQGPAITLFREMNDFRARIRTIQRLAREKLTENENEIMNAAFTVVKGIGQKRHDFAHNIWGFTDLLPDAILLADPIVVSKPTFTMKSLMERLKKEEEVKYIPILDYHLIYVYKIKDLEDICQSMQLANFIVARIYMLTESDEKIKNSGRDLLNSEPHIQSALDTLRTRGASPS